MTKGNNSFLKNSLKNLAEKYVADTSVLQRIVIYLDSLNQTESIDVKWIFYEIIKTQKISDADRVILENIGREYL